MKKTYNPGAPDASHFITKLDILRTYMILRIEGLADNTPFEDFYVYYFFWFNQKNIREFR